MDYLDYLKHCVEKGYFEMDEKTEIMPLPKAPAKPVTHQTGGYVILPSGHRQDMETGIMQYYQNRKNWFEAQKQKRQFDPLHDDFMGPS